MNESKPLSARHEERTNQAYAMRIAYAQVYAMLYRKRRSQGKNIAGIQVMAAEYCGCGKDSKGDWPRYRTRRSMSSRFMKDPVVEAELVRQGLLKHRVTGEWYDPKLD